MSVADLPDDTCTAMRITLGQVEGAVIALVVSPAVPVQMTGFAMAGRTVYMVKVARLLARIIATIVIWRGRR